MLTVKNQAILDLGAPPHDLIQLCFWYESLRDILCDEIPLPALIVPTDFIGYIFEAGITSDADIPTGFLPCDGRAISRVTYSILWSRIGNYFGNGDGSTTFNIPDLRDRVLRGRGNMGGIPYPLRVLYDTVNILGVAGGDDLVTLSLANLPPHRHTWLYNSGVVNSTIFRPPSIRTWAVQDRGVLDNATFRNEPNTGWITNTSQNPQTVGGGNPADIMNPFTVMYYLIYTGVP